MLDEVAWAALRWPGTEHVLVSRGPDGFRADSQAVVVLDTGPVRVRYQLSCDPAWRVTELAIEAASARGRAAVTLTAGGDGGWAADGRARPDLAGCVDVDISCTPLTNTLPIRRLGGPPGTTHELAVCYVSVPELEVRPVAQRYTLLRRLARGRGSVYRYESSSFRADLHVDEEGFVVDYPGLWLRLGAQPATGAKSGASSMSADSPARAALRPTTST